MQNESPQKQASILTAPFEQVVSLCKAFSGEQDAGSKPSLESYLAQVSDDAQPMLLRNLLAVDIDNRRAAGEQPRVEEYLERFPQFATLIRNVFLDLSSISSIVSHETARPKLAAKDRAENNSPRS